MLDIGVGYAENHPPTGTEPSFGLNDDGYYWFLHPLFERLAAETGQYVDLYGDASFNGPNLVALERMLREARSLAEAQPDAWQFHSGAQLQLVRKDELLRLIESWERVIVRAREVGRPVVCFGD